MQSLHFLCRDSTSSPPSSSSSILLSCCHRPLPPPGPPRSSQPHCLPFPFLAPVPSAFTPSPSSSGPPCVICFFFPCSCLPCAARVVAVLRIRLAFHSGFSLAITPSRSKFFFGWFELWFYELKLLTCLRGERAWILGWCRWLL